MGIMLYLPHIIELYRNTIEFSHQIPSIGSGWFSNNHRFVRQWILPSLQVRGVVCQVWGKVFGPGVGWQLWPERSEVWGDLGAPWGENCYSTDGKLMGNWWETDGSRRFYIKSLEFRTGILQHVWIHLWTLDRSSRNSWSTFSKKILGFTISETPWYLRVWKCGVV